MPAPPPKSELSAKVLDWVVARCERVDVGPASSLVRVTVDLLGSDPTTLAGARLLASEGGEHRLHDALPAPIGSHGTRLTLGFALRRDEIALALALGDRSLPLSGAPAADRDAIERLQLEALRCLSQQLREAHARLAESHFANALMQIERDHARRATARAEAAAYDASERAETAVDAERRATARAEAAAYDASARAEIAVDVPDVPDVPARGRRRGPPRTAAAACVLSCTVLAFAVLGWPIRDGASDASVAPGVAAANSGRAGPPAAAAAVDGMLARQLQIPVDYLGLYRAAGARYGLDWTRLAAVGAIESTHGQARAAGVAAGTNTRGARGPAQFLAGTWERFGVDGDANGVRKPHDAADAIPAMASYLRASGAPQDWRVALRSYNHSDAYVDAVERLAARYREIVERRIAR
ncbi:MAG TPA: lytic transglycosylase domain-containing protein [Solirubrobacteraceae bacterium]|nr:lytic transglycosylase domain-containing protein [Solirubrobacteraceae bacterium]